MDSKEYVIGDRKFTQKHLVWGQARQLIKEIEGVELPSDYTPKDILGLLEAKLPNLISIVLIPEGQTAKSKNNAEMLEFFEWELSLEGMVNIVEDFFECNPIPSWLEKMGMGKGMINGFEKSLEKETGLTETSLFSAEETLQSETL